MTPFLIFMGIPPAYAVPNEASNILGTSVSGSTTHYLKGTLDYKMGLMIVIGGTIGTLLGILTFSYLKDIGRAEYGSVTDAEALDALKLVSELEGIIPALETAHAFAWLEKLCPTLDKDTEIVINCSGRGDKDVNTVASSLDIK